MEKWNFLNRYSITSQNRINLQLNTENLLWFAYKLKQKTFHFINPNFSVNISEKCTLELFRCLARGRKSGLNFITKLHETLHGYLIGSQFRGYLTSRFWYDRISRGFIFVISKAKETFKIKMKRWYASFHNKFQLLFHGTHRYFETLSLYCINDVFPRLY